MTGHDKDNFVKTQEGLNYVCIQVASCAQHVVETWHANQKTSLGLQPCLHPQTCPRTGKPTRPRGSCVNCISWGTAIESVYFPPSGRGGISWPNVNPTLFYNDSIEIAKAFVLRLPHGANPTTFTDFDPASLMKIMLGFGVFHGQSQASYDAIKKVSDIRNELAHMKLKNSLNVDDDMMNTFFNDIDQLVLCLENLNHFTATQADDIRSELNKIQTNPVTSEMEERALQPVKQIAVEVTKTAVKQSLGLILAVIVSICGVLLMFGLNNQPRMDADTTNQTFDVANLKRILIDIYQEKTGHIINLPWNKIHHGKRQMEDIFVELHLEKQGQGNLERYTDLVKLKDEKGKTARRILLKGLAGSGKTTLLSKLAYDWSKQENDSPLKKFELVFLLRMNALPKNYSLIAAICDHILESEPEGLKTYIKQYPEKVLILFDGWDESNLELKYLQPSKEGKKELIIELIIRNDVMRKSCVIVSTRPHKQLYHEIQSHYLSVNVEGFSYENIYKYINVFFNDSSGKIANHLMDKLRHSDVTWGISKIPVLLMMLCTLWEDQQTFPDTQSLLYQEFIDTLWERLSHKKVNIELASSTFTNREYENFIAGLGRIALDGLLPVEDARQDILEFEEESINGSLCELGLQIGLITRRRWQFKLREKSYISFIHKSFQEYLAGKYLSLLFDQDPVQFFDILNIFDSWKLVLQKFELLEICCSVSKHKHHASLAVAIIEHAINKHPLVSNISAFESKHVDVPGINGGLLTTMSPVSWKSYLQFDNNFIMKYIIGVGIGVDQDILPILILLRESEIKKSQHLLQSFKSLFYFNKLEVDDSIYDSLQVMENVHYFVQTEFGKETLKNIESVTFKITRAALDVVSDTLFQMPNVECVKILIDPKTRLFISLADISAVSRKTMKAFGRSIAVLPKLSELVMNSTSEVRVEYKSFDMKVVLISLSRSSVSAIKRIDFATYIGDAISHIHAIMTPHLTYLGLTACIFEEKHTEILSAFLPYAPNLIELRLHNNVVGTSIVSLSHNLQHCKKLKILALSAASLQDEGVTELAKNFHNLPNLEELDLSHNIIGNSGLDAVFKHIQDLPKLAHLKIHAVIEGNRFSDLFRKCLLAMRIQIPKGKHNISIDVGSEEVFLCGAFQKLDKGSSTVGIIENVISRQHALASEQNSRLFFNNQSTEITVGRQRDKETFYSMRFIDILPALILLKENQIKENHQLMMMFKSLISSDLIEVDGSSSYTLPIFHYFVKSEFGKATLKRIKMVSFSFVTKDSLDVISDTLYLMSEVQEVEISCRKTKLKPITLSSLATLREELCDLLKYAYRRLPYMVDVSAKLYLSCQTRLQRIELCNNYTSDGINHMGAIVTPHLERLHLSLNDIEVKHIEKLIGFLPNAPNLLYLDLSDTPIGMGIALLVHFLRHCYQFMVILILDRTDLRDAGVTALAENFDNFPNLDTLHLNDNVIGNPGLHAVFQHIPKLQNLGHLEISATIDSHCSDLVKKCLHEIGKNIPVDRSEVYISLHNGKILSIKRISEETAAK